MSQPFTCACGVKTRQPFIVGHRKMCAVCAEYEAPGLVASQASRWNREEWSNYGRGDHGGHRHRFRFREEAS